MFALWRNSEFLMLSEKRSHTWYYGIYRPMAPAFTPKKRLLYFFLTGIIFIVGVPVIVFYSLGYRLTDDFDLVKRGGVYISVPQSEAAIIVNNTLRTRTQFLNHDYFSQNLTPGIHWAAVRHSEHHEWYKEFEVRPQTVAPLYPFLVPRVYETRVVLPPVATSTVDQAATGTPQVAATGTLAEESDEGEEYQRVNALFDITQSATSSEVGGRDTLFANAVVRNTATTTAATATPDSIPVHKRIAGNDTVLWFDGNTVYAYWDDENWIPQRFCNEVTCTQPMPVITVNEPIRHLDFYPGRDDVILFTLSDGLYVAEIDKRPRQVFRRIFEGRGIDFRIEDNDLYVKEGEKIVEVEV